MKTRPLVSILLSLAGIVAIGTAISCSGGGSPAQPSGGISFKTQVYPIFTANCTTSNCHVPGGLGPTDYTQGSAATYGLIVNQKSPGYGQALIVKPGDSGNSVLFAKVSSDTPALTSGQNVMGDGRMPKGLPPLSAGDINTIKTWIDQGAPNN